MSTTINDEESYPHGWLAHELSPAEIGKQMVQECLNAFRIELNASNILKDAKTCSVPPERDKISDANDAIEFIEAFKSWCVKNDHFGAASSLLDIKNVLLHRRLKDSTKLQQSVAALLDAAKVDSRNIDPALWAEVRAAAQNPVYEVPDDPEQDATPSAHPAWRRGYEDCFGSLCYLLENVLSGEDDGVQVCREPWESLRRRVMALVELQNLNNK